MRNIIQENRAFFIGYGIFLLFCIIILSAIEQGDCIRYFSENRTAASNLFFSYCTQLAEEKVYLFIAVCCLFIRFRYSLLFFITGMSIAGMSLLTKAVFAHDRPSVFFHSTKEITELDLLEGIELLIGATSFPSGHTMSAFALYGLLAFLVKRNKVLSGLIFLILAILIGISRIYLVQHFLKDVFAGSLIGVLIALSLYYIHINIPVDSRRLIDRSLIDLGRFGKG